MKIKICIDSFFFFNSCLKALKQTVFQSIFVPKTQIKSFFYCDLIHFPFSSLIQTSSSPPLPPPPSLPSPSSSLLSQWFLLLLFLSNKQHLYVSGWKRYFYRFLDAKNSIIDFCKQWPFFALFIFSRDYIQR